MAWRDGLRLPARPRAQAALDRLSASPTAQLDPSCYDLLASEARLASFVAIAKGDVPSRHWFRLGRAVTPRRPRRGADLLVGLDVRVPDAARSSCARRPGSLLEQTSRLVVRAADRLRRERSACPGASRSRPTTRATSSSPTSTRTSACPASGLKRGLARERRDRALRDRRSPRWSTRGGACANFARLAAAGRARPLRLLRGARLHAGAPARGRRRSRSCAPTWRTTRA